MLGENHRVTTAISDVQDKLAPVFAVVGLATLDFMAAGKITGLVYIGDSLVGARNGRHL